MKNIKKLETFFKTWDLPKNKIIILHSSLKPIMRIFDNNYSYVELTQIIIDCFYRYNSPKTLLIPTYTYSFSKSGIHHQKFSRSETGRFSEEVRKQYNFYRTPNPVFSHLDSEGLLNEDGIIHNNAFGRKSVFGYLHHKDAVVVNMALENFVASPIHYIEQCFDVKYRYFKYFPGVIYYYDGNYENIEFEYFVRCLDYDTEWDREKIKRDLIIHDYMSISDYDGIEFRWLYYDELFDFITKKLNDNEEYLLKTPL